MQILDLLLLKEIVQLSSLSHTLPECAILLRSIKTTLPAHCLGERSTIYISLKALSFNSFQPQTHWLPEQQIVLKRNGGKYRVNSNWL